MSAVHAERPAAAFDLRSAALSLVAFALRTADLGALEAELAARFGAGADIFDGDPVTIDLAHLSAATDPIDFVALLALLRRYRLMPVVARGGNAAQMEAARAAGLAAAPLPAVRPVAVAEEAPEAAPGEVAPAAPLPPPAATLIVDKPLRSGQRVYARGTDLVVLAVVSFGAEVIADGSVHVYAPLRGRAIAGALGNLDARIFTTCLEAQLISIAGIYRSGDSAVPAEMRGKPAQVRLQGEKLVLETLKL